LHRLSDHIDARIPPHFRVLFEPSVWQTTNGNITAKLGRSLRDNLSAIIRPDGTHSLRAYVKTKKSRQEVSP